MRKGDNRKQELSPSTTPYQVTINPLSPHDALKHHFTSLNFLTTKGFRMQTSMKLACQYMVILFNCSSTSNHLHPLQVENCDSNSRLVVDEGDNGKLRLERVKYNNNNNIQLIRYLLYFGWHNIDKV